MDEETPTVEPVATKSGGGFKKILFIALPVLLLAEEVSIEERGVVPFETFLVNLTDPGGNRFLKVTLQLVFESEADAKHVEENAALMGHARSAILEMLTEQNAQALVTVEGKQKLKDGVKAHVSKLFGKLKVVDVLFSEFVVQF